MALDTKKASPEEIAEGLALLEKKKTRDKRIASGEIKGTTYTRMEDLSPEAAAKVKSRGQKQRAKTSVILTKAAKAGITASDAEVEARLKEMG